MAENESIGGIQVDIVGDYSTLQASIDSAAQVAAQGGEKIAEGLNAGAASADAITGALAEAAASAATFEDRVQALVDSGATLAEALATVGSDAAEVATAVEATGAAAASAGDAVQSIGAAADSAATGLESAGAAANQAAPAIEATGTASETAGNKIQEFGQSLLEIAGIGISIAALREFASQAVEVYASTEKATLALGFLMDDSTKAAATIEQLKQTAMDLAVPFDSLVQAEQKMTAFGFSAEQTGEALKAAADAAAASGNSFDAATAAIERMALGGMAGARQLVQLGLSTQDLADTMGVAVGEVAKDFKALDESTRVDVLTEALQKYAGAAETVADSTSGALTRMANSWHMSMEQLGKDLAPVVTAVANFYLNLDYYFAQIIIRAEGMASSFAHSVRSTIDALTLDWTGAMAQYQAAQQADANMAASLATLKQLHDSTAQSIDANTAATGRNVQAEVAQALSIGATDAAAKSLVSSYKDFNAASLAAVTHEQGLADSAAAVNDALGQETVTLANAQSLLHVLLQEYDKGTASLAEVEKAQKAVTTAQAALNKAMADAPAVIAPVVGSIGQFNALIDAMAPVLDDIPIKLTAAQQTLAAVGITTEDVAVKTQKLIDAYEKLQTESPTLEQEDALWQKISQSLTKLSQTDMPQVIALYQQHLNQITALGASEGQILATENQMLAAEIKYGEQSGANMTAEVIGLHNVTLAQQAMIDKSTLMGKTVTGVEDDIIHGFENIGSSIQLTDIAQGKLGADFVKVGEQIAQTIFATIINSAMKAWINSFLDVGAAATKSASSITSELWPAVNSVTKATDDCTISFGNLGREIQSVMGTSSSAAGGAASGLMGLVNTITGIITAIASVIQVIQNVHIEKVLGEIEQNTRYAQIQGEQWFFHDSYVQNQNLLDAMADAYNHSTDLVNSIEEMQAQEYNVLQDMDTVLRGISQQIGQLAAGAGGGTQIQGGPVLGAPPTGGGLGTVGSPAPGEIYNGVGYSGGSVPAPPTVPGAPVIPSGSTSAGAPVTAGSSGAPIYITVQEASDPRETARQIATVLRNISPVFSPYSQA